MLDDDIQYMGTRPAQRAVSDSPLSTRQTINAVVLHIERSGADLPYELIFSRANTDVVHIGRLSSSEVERWHGDSASAFFKCAVVSRSHAKIVFSDSGHAYLIDLKSHHGTHVRKPGESVSKMLVPETPIQLAEGDIITFGKSVGSPADLVRPVVARVELRYRRPDSSLKPLLTLSHPVIHLDLTKGSPKSSSGRYGLYDSSSSSSDDSSSVLSDHDSDIEEIPVSGANAVPLEPRGSHSAEKSSNLTRAFEVLKRLIPPVHAPPSLLFQERLPSEPSDLLKSYSPPLDLSQEYYCESPLYSPQTPSSISYSPRSISPMFNMPNSLLTNPIDDLDYVCLLPGVSPVEESAEPRASSKSPDLSDNSDGAYVLKHIVRGEHAEHNARSRSSSPMDLASSPPCSNHSSPVPEQANEPSIVGAYPKSRSSSPSAPPTSAPAPSVASVEEVIASDRAEGPQTDAHIDVDVDEDGADGDAEVDEDESEDGHPEAEAEAEAEAEDAGERHTSEPPALPHALGTPGRAEENVAPAASSPLAPGVPDVMKSDVSRLRIGLIQLQGEVEKLQIHRRKYKERFNTNVNKLSDKLSDMDGRIADVNAQYNVLCDQVADAMDVDIPDLQGQVEALQNQMDALAPTLDMTHELPVHERQDVKASIQTLQDLVADMRALRETTQQEMAAALEAVRAARDAALVTIAAHAEVPQVKDKTPVLTSSKRKRYDEQDEDDSGRVENRSESENESELKDKPKDKFRNVQDVGAGVGDDGVADVIMAEGIPTIQPTTLVTNHSGIDVPSPKRARRVATVVVQTATAVTVGAIATWSALAFS